MPDIEIDEPLAGIEQFMRTTLAAIEMRQSLTTWIAAVPVEVVEAADEEITERLTILAGAINNRIGLRVVR